ncbi:hypothetical protein BJY00DRAFT_44757 [Aspergillus carlsbadensis]|nr:hypothetical protein BJY00DRAFT_44757 [Aspergillus carlsbadensis]
MVRTSSPRRQSAASQTGSIDATAHPFIPKQILKKKAISKSEYLLREEWAPETINEYQMIVGEPSVTPVPPPKPTPSVQQQQRPQRPQQQTNTVSNRHGQGRGPNRCMQSQARSSSMFEEWKARSVVTPEKAKGKDKTKETDGDSTASLQGDHKPGNGTAPKVPDINLKETNAAPTASSPKHHKPKLNAAPTVSEHTVKQASHTPIVPVLGPNKMGGGAASGDDMVKDSSVTPTASSQPPRTEGNATPVVEKNKAKETNSTPTASPQVPKTEGGAAPITRDDKGSHVAPTPTLKTKHRRRSSAASGVTNKVRGTRAVPTSMPQAPKSDGGAAPVVKANKVNGTDAAAVPLSRNKHKRGGSAVSITSSHKTKGAGVTSAVSTQAGNKAEVNVPIIDDNKVERSGVTFNASPQVNGKTEESPASVNSAGEHPDKAVENQIEPNQTCDVKFHQQKPENLAGGSAGKAPNYKSHQASLTCPCRIRNPYACSFR